MSNIIRHSITSTDIGSLTVDRHRVFDCRQTVFYIDIRIGGTNIAFSKSIFL